MTISRYLTKEICTVLIANTLILLLIFVSNQLAHFMQIAVSGHLTPHFVSILLMLKMPQLLGTALPLSLFLSIILAYGRLYSENEMIILFTSGIDIKKIVKITMIPVAIVTILISVLIFWASPHINKYVNNLLRKGAISPLELVTPGIFQNTSDGAWVLYSEHITKNHKKLQHVFVANQSNHGSNDVLVAKTAHQQFDKTTSDLFLVLDGGTRYVAKPENEDFQIVSFEEYGIRIADNNKNITKLQEDSADLKTLFHNYKDKSSAAELQWRLSIPIMAIVLSLLAIPMSRVKTRKSRYVQLVPSILLFIIYGNFLYLGREWVRDGKISVNLGVWWVHAGMLLLAIMLILRQSSLSFSRRQHKKA